MDEKSEHNGNYKNSDDNLLNSIKRGSRSDEGREPELVQGRLGTRMMSFAALVERIVTAFEDEHSADSAVIKEANTEADKLKLVRDTAEYVIAVESVDLVLSQKADIIRRVYAELFTYGPIDGLLQNSSLTSLLIEGADKVSIRRGHNDLEKLSPIFDDNAHFQKVLNRMLIDAGVELDPEIPIMEFGLTVDGRPIGINLVLPPVTYQPVMDIRIHPKELQDFRAVLDGFQVDEKVAVLLEAITKSKFGFIIAGDTESGKTTFLSAISQILPETKITSVERSGELRLPDEAEQLIVSWKQGEGKRTFGQLIYDALASKPECLLLDEVRSDEPASLAPLLIDVDLGRQIWAFRGPANAKRLSASLGMLARRSNPSHSEEMVMALYERLPFIITVRRLHQSIQLRGLAEWQPIEGSDYPSLIEIVEYDGEKPVLTGRRCFHDLDLPETFWD